MLRNLCTLTCGLILAWSSTAFAGDAKTTCEPPPRYEWVLRHECKREPYRVCETRVDECGRSYTVTLTRYRTVQVPVWQYVRVR